MSDDPSQNKEEQNELETAERQSLFDQVRAMTPPEKIRLALKADRAARAVLLTDGDPSVLFFLCKNPKITLEEIVQIAKNPRIAPTTLDLIVQYPQWMGSDEVKYFIVMNPKVPIQMALRLLPQLNPRHLQSIAKNQNIRAAIKSAAVKLTLKRFSSP